MDESLALLCRVNAELDEELAGKLIELARAGIDREYPNHPGHVLKSATDLRSPRELHPVFYGHFDWHSSVHGHWTLVRLLKLFPGHAHGGEVRKILARRFTAAALQAEADYLRRNSSFERMYGWAWALRLGLELRMWDDMQAQQWAEWFAPIEAAIVAHVREHLAKLAWPIRCGFHPESAFPLAQMLDYARALGQVDLEAMLVGKCRAFFAEDEGYPVRYEPSGHDFFSAGLNEADLMRRVLGRDEFRDWLGGFFPGLAEGCLGNLLEPVVPADLEDGHAVHLVGLNLSRAWTMRGIASALAEAEIRRVLLLEAAERHKRAGLRQVFTGSYEGEHWLGSFAVYLLTQVGCEDGSTAP